MKVYRDLYSNDEVCSDAYDHLDPFDNPDLSSVAFEVKTSKVAKGEEDYGIGYNDEEGGDQMNVDPNVEVVVDVVDKFALQSLPLTKKDYSSYIKKYIQRLVATLQEKNPERVEPFKTSVSEFVKHVLANFDDFEFYVGESLDYEAGLVYGYYKGEEVSPRLVFLKDGLVEERY
ncbi:p23 (translationally controlled tumor protein homolog), putative [Theileria annulata]|uniref:Translationally-controlled tumor protein homolog n=1 Tax=Theileria annulata TaxID=5874 RepID=TCTP_THEAN|nr:p23 (translationally controlled tumor protein homolog), putative [Theileria annulata]Q4UGL5.1 RecName: Full=Translationally-controlled tumor protein homolog; Short=TCTP [Theileria annulata]CAI73774.1 p23 (translationally controlled tumor protein homolog), putative [Theileria annulata]|eukprot:XP_954451.1 p23 (translationally controlled tumor protein homolog), putative [Theileria annulata]